MSPSAVRRLILSALLIAVSLLGVGCSLGEGKVFSSNRAEVLREFPLRPLYESPTLEKQAKPQWFLGGRRYPDSGWAELVYDPTGARYDSTGVVQKQLWANGGVNVTFWWYPDPVTEEGQSGLRVTVRGRHARAVERRDIPPRRGKKPPGVVRSDVNQRWIMWQMPFKGGTLRFEVSAHPDKWSTEQMVALINDFTEIK